MKRLLRAAAVLAAALGLGATGVVVSNASQLPVTGGDISVGSVAHPCAGRTLAVTTDPPVTGTTSTVSVTTPADWPAACVGKRIDLVVADGTVTRTGFLAQAPAANTTTPVGLNAAFTPASTGITASAVVAGWSLGTSWSYSGSTSPYGTCTVVHPSGNPIAGQTCSITSLSVNTWGTPGAREGGLSVTFSSTGVNGQQRVEFALNLAAAQGLPQGWNWSTSGVKAKADTWVPATGYRCSTLPTLSGQTIPGWGSYSNVYIPFVENRVGVTQLACS